MFINDFFVAFDCLLAFKKDFSVGIYFAPNFACPLPIKSFVFSFFSHMFIATPAFENRTGAGFQPASFVGDISPPKSEEADRKCPHHHFNSLWHTLFSKNIKRYTKESCD